jgi:hypothetical protein
LLGFIAIAAIYGGWKWLFAKDELNGRPYWIIGMSALSIAAALRGDQAGSAAWGVSLVLFGGLSFLYSARQVWFTRVLAALGLFLMALPYTLTATGWVGQFPLPFLFWPVFLTAHVMLVAGYIRHLFHAGETRFSELPRWAQASYPIGLGLLGLTILISSFWGWAGALQLGSWIIASVLAVLAGVVVFGIFRFRSLAPAQTPLPVEFRAPRFAVVQDAIVSSLWLVYRSAGRLFGYVANLLEGDGGLLWTLLLLVLLVFVMRGR